MCLAFSIQLDMARVYTQFICECLNWIEDKNGKSEAEYIY